MIESKNQSGYTGIDRRAPRPETGVVTPGVVTPGVVTPGVATPAVVAVRDAVKTGGRHSAITNTLYNWHSYKNWADKVRGSWDEKK